MKILYKKTFVKDLKKIKDKKTLSLIDFYINNIKENTELKDISNISKLKGYKNFYRIKINNYRLGFKMIEEENSIVFIRFLIREDIYKRFP